MTQPSILEAMFGLNFDLTNHLCQASKMLSVDITPMHVRVMRAIEPNPKATANVVATTLKRDKAQVTRLVNDLLDRELLQRAPNPSDGRSQLLSLTKKGQVLFVQLEEIDEDIKEAMLAGITKADAENFLRLAVKMSSNLEKAKSISPEADCLSYK